MVFAPLCLPQLGEGWLLLCSSSALMFLVQNPCQRGAWLLLLRTLNQILPHVVLALSLCPALTELVLELFLYEDGSVFG